MEKLSNIKAIRGYFETGTHGRKVEMQEFKDLSADERQDLGDMCRKELE